MKTHTHKRGLFASAIIGLASAALFLFGQNASAAGQVTQTLPFYDSFDYNPGSAGLASASSTVWETCYGTANIRIASGSLSLPGFVPSAGNSVFGYATGVRFGGTQFTSQPSVDGNSVYFSFLYQVTAYPHTNGLIAFLDSTNVGNSSSAPIPPHAGLALLMNSTGQIGINSGSTAIASAHLESAATALNTTVLIVGCYTFHPAGNDSVALWVNPASSSYGAASAPAPDITLNNSYNLASLADFTLSYDNGDTTFGEKWDEVRIGTTWAQAVPSSPSPGVANAAHSLMTSATPTTIVASGSSTSIVQMQARDLNGVNLTTGGATVTFATTLGTLSATTDNGNGTYQATLTSATTAGVATITAKLGGTAIATIGTATNSPSLLVTNVLGPVSATASTATANPTTVAADGATASTITITAMDDYNHPLSGQTVTLNVSGSGNIVSTPAPTAANGQTTATLKSTVGETKTITVTIGSTQINAQPMVTFTAAGVSGANSTAVANPTSGLVADGNSTSTITVTAISGTGAPLSGQTVTLSATGSGNILTQPSAQTDVNGVATGTLQSTGAGTKTISVNIEGTVINAQPTVTFVPGPATQIAFSAQPVTTPAGQTLPAVVVQIEDALGNAVPQSGATVTLTVNTGPLSGTNPQTTDATGKATFADLSIPAISSGLYLTANVPGFSPAQSAVFSAPAQTYYKVNNTSALNLPASWTAVDGGPGPAGPPGPFAFAVWDTNVGGSTLDIGASASWYGIVYGPTGSDTFTDTAGGHTLTLGAGGLNAGASMHSLTMNNSLALSADQAWQWSSNGYTLTVGGNLDLGGHTLTINVASGGSHEIFNGAVTDSGGLTLTGTAASVTLSGTNTYSGNTTVSSGKLIINSNGSCANTAIITVSSNTTLDISLATPFTLSGSQTLAGDPTGNGTATIVASTAQGPGSLIFAPGAQADFTIAGGAGTVGKITVNGGVTLNGNAVTINVTGAPLASGSYTLMTATNNFTLNGSLPAPAITGQGLANGAAPQLVINGQSLQLVVDFSVLTPSIHNTCGSSATFAVTPAIGATNYQWYNPSLQPIQGATSTNLVLTNTHPADSGTYLIVATGPDFALTNSVVLLTTDTAPPVMALNGAGTVVLTLGSAYAELGATAYDACAAVSLPVTTSGTVNTSAAGEYDITYSATTGAGTPGSLTRAVIVIDPTVVVPGITMNLDFGAATDANAQNPITVPAGWSLLAFGDLYQSPNIWGSPAFANPDGKNPGLTLSFGNISGWSTASVEAGANSSAVVGISTNGFFNYGSKGSGLPATFTLSGVPTGECVSIYAVDAWGGAALAPVIVFGGETNTVTASSFDASPSIGEFQYVGTAVATNGIVSGSWTGIGGASVEGQIGGMIIQVQSIPLNNLTVSPSSLAVQCGSNTTFTASVYGLPPTTYQWYDNNTNAIQGATNSTYTVVAPTDASVGNYTVVAQNTYGALTNSAAITAVLHTEPPIMTLNGANPVNLLVGSPYVDAGATAFDLCAQGYLTVTSNNTVNTSVPGNYSVTYYATTADGTPGTLTRSVNVSTTPVFGTNVIVFDPSMTNIQSQLNSVYAAQKYNQFGPQRTALFFKPGQYTNLDIPVGYYTEIMGLGLNPDDVSITGYLHSDGVLVNENATQNFWRSAENFDIIPTNSADYVIWAVSQGTALRRMHIQGTLDLANFTDGNYASGGFLADSKVDVTVSSISQQQWLSRNDVWSNWAGSVWNMVFVGITNPPVGTFPKPPFTTVTNTPLIREKPYLYLDTNGNYNVMVPALETNSSGITWANGPTPGTSIPINQFYIAQANADNASSINAALNAGLNLILAPGVYQLTDTLQVTRPDTVILGLGYPTLIPQTGKPALAIADVDGVKVGGLLFDAGPIQTTTLMQVGPTNSCLKHLADPSFVYDVSMRVGGPEVGTTASCMEINANDTVGDNIWLWRADHGNPGTVGWTINPCNNGLIVNGDYVTMYALFNEHHEQYQTLWNGNWGRLYMYQSELPYDPPSQSAWSEAPGVDGYASYKVADQVTSHQAYGLGVYAVFIDSTNISCFNAIETPTNSQQVNMHDMIAVYIEGETSGNGVSVLDHVINGAGATTDAANGTATVNYLWQYPTFSITPCLNGTNLSIKFPTESWHSYQLQIKNSVTDPTWLNLGSPINGNDWPQAIDDSMAATNRFYQVVYH